MGSRIVAYCLLVAIAAASCTTDFVPPDELTDREYVVEGYITNGEQAIPPYVIITQTIGFDQVVTTEELAANFVSDAIVTVEHDDGTYELPPVCTIPDVLVPLVEVYLGFDPTIFEGAVCIYADVLGSIPTVEGGLYELTIDIDGSEDIRASTTIPRAVPLDSLWWVEPPGEPSDTLARLNALLSDPVGIDFYRYEISRNGGPFVAPLASVTNDLLFEGQEFEVPINNVIEPGEQVSADEFGLYKVGDTIVLRWLTLDEAHFDFWQTRDFNANNVGPFANYTRVASNVDGALGVWGGYSELLYESVVQD